MKNLMRFVAWLVLGVMVLVILAVAVLWFVNRSDQPVSATAGALQDALATLPPVAAQENGYVLAMGFDAALDQDASQVGEQRISWLNNAIATSDDESLHEPARELFNPAEQRTAKITQVIDACITASRTCDEALAQNRGAIAQWLNEQQKFLARYQALLTRPAWRETVTLDARMPFPPISAVMEGQRVFMLHAWLMAEQHNADQVRALLDADMRYWRTVLSSSTFLLDKMVAASALKRNLVFGVLALRQLPVQEVADAVPRQWMRALTHEERSLRQCLAGEWLVSIRGLAALKTNNRGVATLLEGETGGNWWQEMAAKLVVVGLQPQDTANYYAEYLDSLIAVLDVAPAQLPAAMEKARSMEQSHVGLREPYTRLYNITGDALNVIAVPSLSSYVARVYDVEGVRQLALATLQMRMLGVGKNAVESQLAQSELHNPYTSAAFRWDVEKGVLVFDGMEEGPRGHHEMVF